jgi:choice-of-anchor A domain-containing protein
MSTRSLRVAETLINVATWIRENASVELVQSIISCGSLFGESSLSVVSLPDFANGSVVLGDVTDSTGVNFTAEAEQLNATANALCAATDGIPANVSDITGVIALTATSANSSQQTFTINADDLNSARTIVFSFPNASAVESVVVTIQGNTSLNVTNFGIDNGGVAGGQITFVVCSAPHVTLRGVELQGNLLAFNSSVTIENSLVSGVVVAQSLNGTGGGQLAPPLCSTPAASPSASPSADASATPAASVSVSPAASAPPSAAVSPSPSPSTSAAASPSASAAASPSASAAASASPSASLSASPAASPSPSGSTSPIIVGGPGPDISTTPSPSATPASIPSATPSAVPTATPVVAAPSTGTGCPSSLFGQAAAYNVFLSGNPDMQFAFNLTNGDVWGAYPPLSMSHARDVITNSPFEPRPTCCQRQPVRQHLRHRH